MLQVDGYAGYRALAERGEVQLAFCLSNVRRRFYEVAAAGPVPIASEALTRIGALYAVEADIRGCSAEGRRAARQERSRPVIRAMGLWLRARLETISQKGKLAEAIRYALSRWEGLTRFLDDGRIELDSNTIERAIRPIALNRKNAPFAGSDGGGQHWAVLASLVETCKLNNVEPQAYLADVLIFPGQLDDVGGQRRLVITRGGWLALGGTVLAKDLAGPALGNAEVGLHLLQTGAATRRA